MTARFRHSGAGANATSAVADDEWDRAVEAIDADAWYPNVFRESAPTRRIGGYALESTFHDRIHCGRRREH